MSSGCLELSYSILGRLQYKHVLYLPERPLLYIADSQLPFPTYCMRVLLTHSLRLTLLSQFAASVLLLSGCAKKLEEQPTPATSVTQDNTSEVQQLFSEKQYDQLVNPTPTSGASTLKWMPKWQSAIWKNGAERCVYIPLQAQSIGNNMQPTPVKGVLKYLRFQQVAGKWQGCLFSCFYKLPAGDIKQYGERALTPALLSDFTGEVFTQKLDGGEVLHSSYQNGAWQKPTGTAKGKTTGCKVYYFCQWVLGCANDKSVPGETYYTSSEGGCEEPRGYTLGCGSFTTYSLAQQIYNGTVCDDPGNPGDGPDTEYPTIVPDSEYIIKNMNSNLRLITENEANTAGTRIVQNYRADYWRVTSVGGGYYTIARQPGGQVIGVQGASTASGAQLSLGSYTGAYEQQWAITKEPNVYLTYKIISRKSGLALEPANSSTSPRAFVTQGVYAGVNNQLWIIAN